MRDAIRTGATGRVAGNADAGDYSIGPERRFRGFKPPSPKRETGSGGHRVKVGGDTRERLARSQAHHGARFPPPRARSAFRFHQIAGLQALARRQSYLRRMAERLDACRQAHEAIPAARLKPQDQTARAARRGRVPATGMALSGGRRGRRLRTDCGRKRGLAEGTNQGVDPVQQRRAPRGAGAILARAKALGRLFRLTPRIILIA